MTAGSSVLATIRTAPPQWTQVVTAMPNTRLRRCAHVIPRCQPGHPQFHWLRYLIATSTSTSHQAVCDLSSTRTQNPCEMQGSSVPQRAVCLVDLARLEG